MQLRSLPALVAALLGLAATAAVAAPAAVAARPAARAAQSAMAGFAIVQFDGTLFNRSFNYDSAGGSITVSKPDADEYQVVFGRLGFSGGDVQITPADQKSTCTAESWAPDSGGNLVVNVGCYDHVGTPAPEEFQVLVTRPNSRPNGVFDYDWVFKANGKLGGQWQYNSSGKVNSVRHLAKGVYLVSMPGPGLKGPDTGTVKVTPYGVGGGNCLIGAWRTTRTGEQITVRCFDRLGNPADREFDIVYARGNNLMGLNGKTTANALANGHADLYQPKVQFDSARHARVTIIHTDRGFYIAVLVGSHPTGHANGGFGNVQVSPVGQALRYCAAFPDPSHTPLMEVACFDAAGHPADTAFTIQWAVT